MAARNMTPSGSSEPQLRLRLVREGDSPAFDTRLQTEQEALVWCEGPAPILHFATGGSSPERLRLLQSFNEERNYAAARRLFDARTAQLRRFQEYSLQWILDVVSRRPGAMIHKRLAERYRATPAQRAAFVENVAFELIMTGQWAKAKAQCRDALAVYPTSQGLWINLLVALTLLEQQATVEELLFALPGVVDVDAGLIGAYLLEVPDLRRPVCNGG